MTLNTPVATDELISRLSTRLDAKALTDLEELSAGQGNFTLHIMRLLLTLLENVCPRMEACWAARDYIGTAQEVHKLRSSVSYAGARELDALVSQCERRLRAHDGDLTKPENQETEKLAAAAVAEARSLLEWLRPILAEY